MRERNFTSKTRQAGNKGLTNTDELIDTNLLHLTKQPLCKRRWLKLLKYLVTTMALAKKKKKTVLFLM